MAISTIDTSSISGLGYGFKNRILNGGMQIDQRNAGAIVTGAIAFTLDRWETPASGGPVWNVQQVSDAPTGHTNSIKATVTTASSSSTGYSYFRQQVEGYNWADIGYGTANAQVTTLSFWVKSSIVGTYGLAFRNTSSGRFYTTTYTINAANTWEQKTVTIAGDTSGTWNTTNGSGFQLFWDTGTGSNYSSASNNAWSTVASNYFGITGVTKLSQTSGATFQITGVQLEKGTVATSFDYRPYGTELALCRRYALKMGNDTGNVPNIAFGPAGNTTASVLFYYPQVAFRSTPSLESYSGLGIDDTNGTISISALSIDASSSPNFIRFGATATGLTQFRTYFLRGTSSAGNLVLSAEL